MPFDFPDLDEKLKNNRLTLKDVVRKALAMNIALRKHIMDNGNYKNHVFQGYIVWALLLEYLLNKEGLNLEVSNFLVLLKEQLNLALDALEKSLHNPIRHYIMRLNEAEIITRSPQGKIYTEYSEKQKTNVLNFLRENNLIREQNGELFFNMPFYLFYRERDGRFFLISERKIDFGQALNLDSCFAEDLQSTHICINEGFSCSKIYEQQFLEYHKQHQNEFPCTVEGEGNFIYCGKEFKDIQLSGKMAQIELCKNPPAEEIHCLYLEGSIVDYKKNKLGIPEQTIPVPLHITIGRKLREPDPQIARLATEELVDLLNQCQSSYIKPLLNNRYLFATELNSLTKERTEKLNYGFFPLVTPEEMGQWENLKKENEPCTGTKPW